MKVSSRDCLDILRRFDLASELNVPKNIENLRVTNPSPTNTLAEFKFNRFWFYILFDDVAEDDESYIFSQLKTRKSTLSGELIKNPISDDFTYAMPFKGKSCYLYESAPTIRRLDLVLVEKYPEFSRSTIQKYIKSGFVSINGDIEKSIKFDVSDTAKISMDIPAKNDFSKNELPIIYIDDNVIVVNKPAGVLTHAKGVLNDEFTVADFFKRYTDFGLDTNRPGIVHRLDRDTSGVIIGARNTETAKLLQKQFADRKTKKTYFAILAGHPKLDKAIIDLPIDRDPKSPSTFRVDANGKSAVTKYEIINRNDKYSLVELQPKTGRTHQLRVHMKYLNTPILGDRVYAKPDKRLYLHAHSLEITIPSGERKTFTAPLPDEFMDIFPER